MPETQVGVISHYFDKIGVAIVSVTDGEIAIGDSLKVKGTTSDVSFTVESLRLEKDSVTKAEKGQSAGTKVPARVRVNDKVFKVTA